MTAPSTRPCSAKGDDGDADGRAHVTDLLEKTRKHAQLARECAGEVERLLDRMQTRTKQMAHSGIPTFLRSLQREKETLCGFERRLLESSGSPLPEGEDEAKDKGEDDHRTRRQLSAQEEARLQASITTASRSAAQWDRLKRCRGLVAVNQNFQGSSRDARLREAARRGVANRDKAALHRVLKEQGRVEVDVVDGGGEWIVAKAVQRERLARQLGDCGWSWGEHERGDEVDEDEWADVPLAKLVARLAMAARLNRHEYRFPRIRVVLTTLRRRQRRHGRGYRDNKDEMDGESESEEEGTEDLDIFLDQLSRIDPLVGVTVEGCDGPLLSPDAAPGPLDEAMLQRLAGDDSFRRLTQTVNLDHTVLIDLISDLTHAALEPKPWQLRTTRAQIDEENAHEGGLMAKTLYPVLAGRRLVCTREAAAHLQDVLRTVGTATERERGRLLVPPDIVASETETTETTTTPAPTDVESIRRRFQELSIHRLPADVQLPVSVVDESWDADAIDAGVATGRLPRVALDVARRSGFKTAKMSIFAYGWAAGVATVTSNREVRGQIRTWIEAHRWSDDEAGPQIYRVDVTRNLLAKAARPRHENEEEMKGVSLEDS